MGQMTGHREWPSVRVVTTDSLPVTHTDEPLSVTRHPAHRFDKSLRFCYALFHECAEFSFVCCKSLCNFYLLKNTQWTFSEISVVYCVSFRW